MPSKNTLKAYLDNSNYHLYNRGVEKRKIFQDPQDYAVFLSYLKEYLLPKDVNYLQSIISSPSSHWRDKDKALKLLKLNNFSQEITLQAYCLMPNHFHLLVKQKSANSIDRFTQSLCTRYSMYFNRKNKRIGPLYQDAYKAVSINNDEQLLHLTRYIHKQAIELPLSKSLQGDSLRSWKEVQPCSFGEYVGERHSLWVKPEEVLAYFKKQGSSGNGQSLSGDNNTSLAYENFVRQVDDEQIFEVSLEEN